MASPKKWISIIRSGNSKLTAYTFNLQYNHHPEEDIYEDDYSFGDISFPKNGVFQKNPHSTEHGNFQQNPHATDKENSLDENFDFPWKNLQPSKNGALWHGLHYTPKKLGPNSHNDNIKKNDISGKSFLFKLAILNWPHPWGNNPKKSQNLHDNQFKQDNDDQLNLIIKNSMGNRYDSLICVRK